MISECKRIFDMKIIIGFDVKVVYSIIAIGKKEYQINAKLAIASKFWYTRISSLMKYSYLANICIVSMCCLTVRSAVVTAAFGSLQKRQP